MSLLSHADLVSLGDLTTNLDEVSVGWLGEYVNAVSTRGDRHQIRNEVPEQERPGYHDLRRL